MKLICYVITVLMHLMMTSYIVPTSSHVGFSGTEPAFVTAQTLHSETQALFQNVLAASDTCETCEAEECECMAAQKARVPQSSVLLRKQTLTSILNDALNHLSGFSTQPFKPPSL